jgi:DNA-binding NtrC family response regulator
MEETDILVGPSPAMQTLVEDVELAARSAARVLIAGESGVGKQTVARLIHARSTRADGPFIPVCCADLERLTDVGAELGHSRPGAADGGTIFLKGIGDLNPPMQARLLRWLEASPGPRIIASAEAQLVDRLGDHRFSQELYYRLNVLYLWVPPLRGRRSDIPALLDGIFTKLSIEHRRPVPALAADARAALIAYSWPGNIRELKNTAQRVIEQHEGGVVRLEDLPLELRRDAVA